MSDERFLAFRGELLRRWPELADVIAPWHRDLDRRQPWGRIDRLTSCFFQYPLEGSRALTVHVAQSPGSAVVSVRVEENLDAVLAARVETPLGLV